MEHLWSASFVEPAGDLKEKKTDVVLTLEELISRSKIVRKQTATNGKNFRKGRCRILLRTSSGLSECLWRVKRQGMMPLKWPAFLPYGDIWINQNSLSCKVVLALFRSFLSLPYYLLHWSISSNYGLTTGHSRRKWGSRGGCAELIGELRPRTLPREAAVSLASGCL